MWYGWPDFSAGNPIANDEEYKVPKKEAVKPLLQQLPNQPPKPAAVLVSILPLTGSTFRGTQHSDFPAKPLSTVWRYGPGGWQSVVAGGFKVVRVNVETGVIRDFGH
jgi:hypothetical protein